MRNSSTAQLEMLTDAQETPSPSALKQAVAERLAQHRAKGTGRRLEQPEPEPEQQVLSARAAKARAAVTERYAKSPSYREVLAAEAQRSMREAEAAAEVAARNAQAVAQAQQQLLAELEHWAAPEPEMAAEPAAEQLALAETTPIEILAVSRELRVQHHEELAPRTAPPVRASRPQHNQLLDEDEQYALDEEIAFRQSPDFGVHEPLPANLIEFPRQLVAAVKVRPRLAEGPLVEESEPEPQLRIFEVEASQLSAAPAVELPHTEWVPLVLETAKPEPQHVAATHPVFLPQVAPIGLRLMSGIVDACLVFTAALAFLTVAALEMHPLPQKYVFYGFPAAFLVMHVLYQLLFFTWSEMTPGMRYARIGLCTFTDDNPTRKAMRRRILATVLSAAPLGLGFLWACLDEDGLGWHDRISRIYQRSY